MPEHALREKPSPTRWPIKTRRLSWPEQVAYHEAGHAVAAYVRHGRFTKVSMVLDDESVGRCNLTRWSFLDAQEEWVDFASMDPSDRQRRYRETVIVVALAGDIVQRMKNGRHRYRFAGHDDLGKVYELVTRGWPGDPEEPEAYVRWLWYRTRGLLAYPVYWTAVEALAQEILACKELGERRARAIIKDAMERWERIGGLA